MNLSQKKRTSKEILNKFKSKSNIYGSISNLRNSKNSLYGSRTLYGSSMVLNKNHHFEQNQEPTDRITFENTYQLKPTKKFSSYEVKKMLDELLKKNSSQFIKKMMMILKLYISNMKLKKHKK